MLRRNRTAVTLMSASLSGALALVLWAGPAGASNKEITVVGGNTTNLLMHNIFGPSINDLLPGGTTTNQRIVATTEFCKGGVNYSATHTVTGHAVLTYPTGAPNGSSKGKAALKAEEPTTTVTTHIMKMTETACIDDSRSSSPPKTSTVSTHFDYYAYALDGVAPLVGSNAGGSIASPVVLSLATMKNIYLCKPGYTNWKTVTGATAASKNGLTTQGGVTAPIIRFWPQPTAGTRSVYTSMMGFTPGTTSWHTAKGSTCGTSGHPTADRPITRFTVTISGTKRNVYNEENSEEGIIYDARSTSNPTVIKDAIYIYSAGRFESEWNTKTKYNLTDENSITEKTGATAIGNFDAATLTLARYFSQTAHPSKDEFLVYGAPLGGTFTPTTNRGDEAINTTVVKESNEWFSHIPSASSSTKTSKALVPGVRYVYNVADTVLPSYDAVKSTFGFDNVTGGVKSALCNGDDAAAISASGFVALNGGSTAPANTGGGYGHTGTAPAFGGTSDKANGFCREFPGKHLPTYGGTKHWTSSTWVAPT